MLGYKDFTSAGYANGHRADAQAQERENETGEGNGSVGR